jgi:cytochrome c biogenesis protein CcdA
MGQYPRPKPPWVRVVRGPEEDLDDPFVQRRYVRRYLVRTFAPVFLGLAVAFALSVSIYGAVALIMTALLGRQTGAYKPVTAIVTVTVWLMFLGSLVLFKTGRVQLRSERRPPPTSSPSIGAKLR